MKLSAFGADFITKREAFVDHVYPDQIGKPTIGYGHLVREGESFPPRITRAKALELFQTDVAWVEDAVNKLVSFECTQRQFDMLCSLVFNIGAARFARSQVRARLNAGDVGTADRGPDGKPVYTLAMLEWAGFNEAEDPTTKELVVLQDLVNRRALEIAVFAEEEKRRHVEPTTDVDLRDPALSEIDFGEKPPDGEA